jgi:hypothetical protein
MDEPTAAALDRECTVFTRYLVGGEPTNDLRRAYRQGHARIPFRSGGAAPDTALDRWALRLTHLGAPGVRAADAYHRFFHPAGALRQKLTLLLAILEHAPPFHIDLNRGGAGGPIRAAMGLAGVGIAFGLSLVVGTALLGPIHLWSLASDGRTTERLGDADRRGERGE